MSDKTKQLLVNPDEQERFNPKTNMGSVIDDNTGEDLYSYLSRFNHLNIGYVASAVSAREAVPAIMRKTGLIVTYYINEKPITEQYVGNKDTAGTDTWTNDNNWQFIDGIGQVDTNSVTLNQLSQEVLDLIGKNKKVNITNYPDGEDLIQVNICGGNSKNEVNVLKFADKEYNPANFSGLGRIYLRKNIVEVEQKDGTVKTINLLTQDMINKENTRYIIQYDYDLNGKEITIPEGCVLDFQGGGLNNTTKIIGNNTKILGNYNYNGVKYYGNWYNKDNKKLTYKLEPINNNINVVFNSATDTLIQKYDMYKYGINTITLQLRALYKEDGTVNFINHTSAPLYLDDIFENCVSRLRQMKYNVLSVRFELKKDYMIDSNNNIIAMDYTRFSNDAERSKLINGYKSAVSEEIAKWASVKEEFGIEYCSVENECYRNTFTLIEYEDYYNMLKELGTIAKNNGFKSMVTNIINNNFFGNYPNYIQPTDFDYFGINTYFGFGYKEKGDIIKPDNNISNWLVNYAKSQPQFIMTLKQNKDLFISESGILTYYGNCNKPWAGADGEKCNDESIIKTYHINTINYLKQLGSIKVYCIHFGIGNSFDYLNDSQVKWMYNFIVKGKID